MENLIITEEYILQKTYHKVTTLDIPEPLINGSGISSSTSSLSQISMQ